MTLQHAVLEMDVDFGSPYGEVTGVFHLYGDAKVREQGRTGYILGEGRGSSVNGIVQETRGPGAPKRKGVHADLGGGQHVFSIEFIGWEGAQDADGNALQWGADPTEGVVDPTTATGADPTSQVNIFMHYWRVGRFDSIFPARLRYGEYSDGTYADEAGELDDYLPVTIEEPDFTRKAGENDKFDGTITLVETLSLDAVEDGKNKLPY